MRATGGSLTYPYVPHMAVTRLPDVAGADCSTVQPAKCPSGCSGRGQCTAARGGPGAAAVCACAAGFGGRNCGQVVGHEHCLHSCSGHGCVSHHSLAVCGRCVSYRPLSSMAVASHATHLPLMTSFDGRSCTGEGGCDCHDAVEYRWGGAGCQIVQPPDGCANGCSGV